MFLFCVGVCVCFSLSFGVGVLCLRWCSVLSRCRCLFV